VTLFETAGRAGRQHELACEDRLEAVLEYLAQLLALLEAKASLKYARSMQRSRTMPGVGEKGTV
jgi:hypothetical protein